MQQDAEIQYYPYSIELFILTHYLSTENIYDDSISLHNNNSERDRIDTTVSTFLFISC
jgi:hypothetical protein